MEQHFMLYLVLLLVTAKVLEKVLSYGRINPLVAHIVAGIVLGPYVLNLVHPSSDLLAVSYLGLLLLMFYTGLTTNFSELRRIGVWIIAVGVSGVLATMVTSFVALKALGFDDAKALIVSILVSNTATETTAAVVTRCSNDLVRSIAIGASVVDDVLAVIVLGIVAGSFMGSDTISMLHAATMSLALLVASLLVSEVLVRNPRIFYQRIAMDRLVFASTSIVLACVLALVSRFVGLNELIGAYLAGLIVGRGRECHDPLLLAGVAIEDFIDQLRVFLEALALPLFFTYVGLLVAPHNIDPMLYAVLLTIAVLGKVAGCGFATYVATRNALVSLAVGTAMVGRGVLETALLKLLLDAGLLNVEEYSTILLVAVSTTIAAPAMFGYVARSKKLH